MCAIYTLAKRMSLMQMSAIQSGIMGFTDTEDPIVRPDEDHRVICLTPLEHRLGQCLVQVLKADTSCLGNT